MRWNVALPTHPIPHPHLMVQTLHLLNLHSSKHSSSSVLHAHNSWSLRAKFKDWWWWFSHSVMSDSFVSPCSIACQAPLSTGFFRQESWSGLPFPFSGNLLDQGIEPKSSALQADSLPLGESIFKYYSPLKKKTILPVLTTWINLGDTMLSEINQTHKYYMMLLICGIWESWI